MATPAPAPAPAQTSTHNNGPIDHNDLEEWKGRFNDVLARPSEHVNSKSPETSQPWQNSFFGCFSPISLCAITCCVPCVTFGKTHHRLQKNNNLDGYEPVNTSCLLFWASTCVGLHWIPLALQRASLREKHNLQGSCLVDLATACCCGCCDLIQQDKEAEYREAQSVATGEGYKANEGMAMPA